jgi:hypothetical protein
MHPQTGLLFAHGSTYLKSLDLEVEGLDRFRFALFETFVKRSQIIKALPDFIRAL